MHDYPRVPETWLEGLEGVPRDWLPGWDDDMGTPPDHRSDSWEEEVLRRRGEPIEVDGDIFYLKHKHRDEYVDSDVYAFIVENWHKPRGVDTRNLNKGLTIRNAHILRNREGEVVGFGSYCDYADSRNDGELDLFIIREDYRSRRGLGSLLGSEAINKMLIRRKDPESPLILKSSAMSEGGRRLLESLKRGFREQIVLKVFNEYKERDEYDLPRNVGCYWSWGWLLEKLNPESITLLIDTYIDEVYPGLSVEERDNMRGRVEARVGKLMRDEKMLIIADYDNNVVAFAGYESKGEDAEGDEIFELVFSTVHPDWRGKGISETMLQIREKRIRDEEDDANFVSVVSSNPAILGYARERRYQPMLLEEYFAFISDDERAVGLDSMRGKGVQVLVKNLYEDDPYEEVTLSDAS